MTLIRYISPSGNNANSGQASGQAWATLDFAKQQVRDLIAANPAEDIHAVLLDGLHVITEPLSFTALDSPGRGRRVTWRAAVGASPVISGGVAVSTWTLHDAAKNIWVADFTGTECRQLYVNGIRCRRAMRVGGLLNATATDTGFTTTDPITNYENIADVELVFRYEWRESRIKVASAVANTSLTMQQPAQSYYVPLGGASGTRLPYAVENAYEILEASNPATFYLNQTTDKLYLIPPTSVANPNSAQVIAPQCQKLATFDSASRITMYGLQWSHNTWLPEEGGFADIQCMVLNDGPYTNNQPIDNTGRMSPAAIELRNSSSISFTDSLFRQCGSTAVNVLGGCENVSLIGNQFFDLSGHGVAVGEPNNLFLNNAPSRVTIKNNSFSFCGEDYHGTVGVFAPYVSGCDITNNDFESLPYDGAAVGWGWGNWRTIAIGPNADNKFRNNSVNQVMLDMSDGGGIYNVGIQNRLLIDGNYIRNVVNGVGIYLDAGTWRTQVSNNVVGFYCPYWLQSHQGFGDYVITGNHAYYPEGTAFTAYDPNWYPGFNKPSSAVEWTPANPAIFDSTNPTLIQATIIADAGREPTYRSALPTLATQSTAFVADAIGDEAGWWLPSETAIGATSVEDKIGSNDIGGSFSIVDAPGAGGRRALRFNGTNQSATLNAYADATSVAYSFWFYKPAGNQSGALLKLGTGDGSLVIGIGNTDLDSDGSNLVMAKEGSYWVTGTYALTTGWHHCVVQIDGDGVAYARIDNQQVIVDGQGLMGVPSGTASLGGHATNSRYLNTFIDDIRYFSRDLLVSELTILAARRGGDADANPDVCDTDFTAWTLNNVTVTDGQADPAGGTLAVRITNDATNGEHRLYYELGASSAGTRGIWAKANTTNFMAISHDGGSGNVFDLTAGTATPYGGAEQGIMTLGPNGWYFCEVPIVTGNIYHIVNVGELSSHQSGVSYVGTSKSILIAGAKIGDSCVA